MKIIRACIFGYLLLGLGCSSGFTTRDIADVQASIRHDFEKKGFTVLQVDMRKESADTLAGVVRLRKDVPNIGDMDFSKVCTATKDQASSHYVWKCEDR